MTDDQEDDRTLQMLVDEACMVFDDAADRAAAIERFLRAVEDNCPEVPPARLNKFRRVMFAKLRRLEIN